MRRKNGVLQQLPAGHHGAVTEQVTHTCGASVMKQYNLTCNGGYALHVGMAELNDLCLISVLG